MDLAGKGLLVMLAGEAKQRPNNDPHLHIADRCDTHLASLMRRVADAQRQLDAYVRERTYAGK